MKRDGDTETMWYMVYCYWDPSNLDMYGPISELTKRINRHRPFFKEQHWNVGRWTVCVLDNAKDAADLAECLQVLCDRTLEYRVEEYCDTDFPERQHWQDSGSRNGDDEMTPVYHQQCAQWQAEVFVVADGTEKHVTDQSAHQSASYE